MLRRLSAMLLILVMLGGCGAPATSPAPVSMDGPPTSSAALPGPPASAVSTAAGPPTDAATTGGGPPTQGGTPAVRKAADAASPAAISAAPLAVGDGVSPGPASSLVVGLGARGGGWFERFTIDSAAHLDGGNVWGRIPATNLSGQSWVASGDVDGDGVDEIVVGVGPSGGGHVYVYRYYNATGYQLMATLTLADPAYLASADASTFPACIDLDGDGRAEIVVGTGDNGRGVAQIFTFDPVSAGFIAFGGTPLANGCVQVAWSGYDASGAAPVYPAGGYLSGRSNRAHLLLGLGRNGGGWLQAWQWNGSSLQPYVFPSSGWSWLQVGWSAYNASADAVTHPALGDLDGDGTDDLVIGLGTTGQGWMQILSGHGGDLSPNGWRQVPWSAYNACGDAPTWPALGDVDGDGRADLFVGLGRMGAGWIYARTITDSWLRVNWPAYNSGDAPAQVAVARGGALPVTSLSLTPSTPTVAIGATCQFNTVATFADNRTQTVTPATAFTSSNPVIAAFTSATRGLASVLAGGTATVTATYGGVSATTTVTVATADPDAAFWALGGTSPVPSPAADRVPLGVNLETVRDWHRSLYFVDAMRTCRRFGSVSRPDDMAAPVDANDWPTGDFGVIVFSSVPHADGTYQLSFQGQGTVSTPMPGASIRNPRYDAATDTTRADVVIAPSSDPNALYGLSLAVRNTRDGARNIRLLRPGYAADTQQVFHTPFLQKIQPFAALRLQEFLNMQGNWDRIGNPQVNWSDRPRYDTGVQTSNRGCSLDYGILLANQTNKDIWVNIPDQATDEYVRQFALHLKNHLKPGLHVYVEWSNEVWNGTYAQAQRNMAAATAEGNAGPCALNDNGATMNPGYWSWRRFARRSIEVSNIFRAVYGDAAMNSTVRVLLASQYDYYYMPFNQLAWARQNYGPLDHYLYGLAAAPYWGPRGTDRQRTDLTVNDVVNLCSAALDLESARFTCDQTFNGALDWNHMPTYNTLAHYYGLHSLGYEGGPDTAGLESLDAKIAANHDPRMATLVDTFLRRWYANGNELFMYFCISAGDSQYGEFGLYPDITQDSVKGAAVVNIATSPLSSIH